jgi:hypothetical protein
MGIAFFLVISVTHKIGGFSPKIEAIPTPWRTSPHQKFRQPTHCVRKSRIRRTREGVASCPLNKRRGGFSSHRRLKVLQPSSCADNNTETTSSCADNNTETTSAILIFNYNP